MTSWQNIGVSATPMAFGEVFTALQQKTIEGQENPYEIIYNGKFYEVQKYITETQHIYTPYVVLFNKAFYDGLSDENKAIISEALDEAINYERETAAASEAEKKQIILDSGLCEITELSADEKQIWRDEMSGVLTEVKNAVGSKGTAIVDALLAETNY